MGELYDIRLMVISKGASSSILFELQLYHPLPPSSSESLAILTPPLQIDGGILMKRNRAVVMYVMYNVYNSIHVLRRGM